MPSPTSILGVLRKKDQPVKIETLIEKLERIGRLCDEADKQKPYDPLPPPRAVETYLLRVVLQS